MLDIFRGLRPDVTPAQLTALLVAGIPILSHVAAAFGVFDPSPDQQQALSDAVEWGGVVASVLIVGDAGVRAARNSADARRDVAAMRHLTDPTPRADDLDHEIAVDDELEEPAADTGADGAPVTPPGLNPDDEQGPTPER